MRTIVERGFVGKLTVGDLGDNHTVILDAQHSVIGDAADGYGVEVPLLEHGEDFVFAAGIGHDEHPLLGFREHDLVGRHAGFALRHEAQVDFDAGPGAAAHFASGAGETGCAHILNADDCAGMHSFKTGLKQKFFHEGIADLDVGTLFLGFLGEYGGSHGRAVNAVAPGFCSDVNYRIADAGGAAVEDFVVSKNTQREDVDQRIAVIAGLKDAFAANGGDAETIAVMRDATDDAFENSAIAIAAGGIVKRTEADGVEHGDGARAHGEDVTQNAADAGGRALERLDETGVVVRLDLEGDGIASAFRVGTDVDNSRVFSRTHQHARTLRRELLQVQAGALVGAMLAPHDREDAHFGLVRLTAEDGTDLGQLRIGELAHAVRLPGKNFIGNLSLTEALLDDLRDLPVDKRHFGVS